MGDSYNVEEKINEYADMVYRLAMSRTKSKENSEDVFQEVFLRLSKKKPVFENKEHEKAWIIRVTINCSKNIINSFWNRNVDTLEEIVFETKSKNDVYFSVLKLPPKYRTIIHLYYYEGYKISEIGDILSMKESTVKTRLSRAKKRLKEDLKGDFDDE